jgi:tripartite-type tricarboxylate transporter receptor subunit TctC
VVPRGTPAQIVTKLHIDFVELTQLPDIKSRMATLGADPVGSTGAELADVIRADIAKYRKIVKEAKITLN